MASTSGTDSTKRRLFSVAALAILEKAFNAGESDYAEIANRLGENETKERVRGWFTRRKAKAKAPDARLAEVSDAADPGQPSSVQPTDDMAEIEAISAASAQCGCEDPSICLKCQNRRTCPTCNKTVYSPPPLCPTCTPKKFHTWKATAVTPGAKHSNYCPTQ